jgi:ATP-dependent Clp protease adaptor protein ClpS
LAAKVNTPRNRSIGRIFAVVAPLEKFPFAAKIGWKLGAGVDFPGLSWAQRIDATVMANRQQEDTVLAVKPVKTKPPPLYKVMLLNDDYTPMDFVVGVLQRFFSLSREQATQVMLKVHREGIGVCGIFPRDVAATKVEQVKSYAKQHQHPLQCVMEEN